MSYIKETLTTGEEILCEGKLSKWYLFCGIFFGVLFIIAGIVLLMLNNVSLAIVGTSVAIGVILLIRAYIIYISTEIAFTNKRIVAKWGFIERTTVELNINKIESVQVNQGILGRIFNFGTIIVSGAGNPQAPIMGISKPMKFRSEFMSYISDNMQV